MSESVSETGAIPGKQRMETWGPILAGLACGVLLIVAENYGFGGPTEWAMVFTAGVGASLAVFWSKRRRPWFWPAAALLIVAHVTALLAHQWRMLPHYPMGTAIQLKGAIWEDFGACALFLYLVHRLIDPHTGTKAHWPLPAKIAASFLSLALFSLIGFTIALLTQAHDRKISLQEVVLSRSTSQSMYQLMDCIDTYKTENDQWDDLKGDYPAKQFFDDFSGSTNRITDKGSLRFVEVLTVKGRPLRQDEMTSVMHCLS